MNWSKQIIRFIVLMMLQVLLINHLQLGGVLHIFLYVYCLLIWPITLPQWANLLVGAAAGMMVDICMNSIGIHMASCILLMQMRPYLLGNLILDKERLSGEICSASIGIKAFMRYAAVLILIHHTCVFMVSAWSFEHIGFSALEILASGVGTWILVMGYDMVRSK